MSEKAYHRRVSQLVQKLLHVFYLRTHQYSLRGKVTLSEYKVLSFLSTVSSADMSQVKNNLMITGAFATNIADRLVKNKLAIRQREGKDRRKVIIAITDKGKRYLGNFEKQREEAFTKIFSSLRVKEKELMEKGISILVRLLES